MQKNITHPAEVFCRKTFLRNPQALEQAQLFYNGRGHGGPEWPEWCALPMAATYAILTQGKDVSLAAKELTEGYGVLELSNLTASLIWTHYKIVYRFDTTLAELVYSQPLDSNIPREALFHMPYPCMFIEDDRLISGEPSIGFFVWLESDMHSDIPELRLLYLFKSGYTVSLPVLLTGGTLDDALTALISSGINRAIGTPTLSTSEATGLYPTQENIAGAINLVLYLCTDDVDMPDDTELRNRRSRDMRGDPKRTVTWDVGLRIGAALRRAYSVPMDTSERTSYDTAGSPKKPHIRRAHWHAYWTGPKAGDRKLIVKWLPPIPVKIDQDEQLPTVIYPIKS